MKIDFSIEHIDPLGQGVYKSEAPDAAEKERKITFIKKTLFRAKPARPKFILKRKVFVSPSLLS